MSVKRVIANGFASGVSLGKTAGNLFKSKTDISAIPERLKDLAESLESGCKAVEPQFIQLGNAISGVYGDVTGLAAYTREIVEKIGGNAEDAAVAQVRRIVSHSLQQLEACRSGVSDNLAAVTRIAGSLGKLGGMVTEAEKIGMFLKVVGLNIQIESARSRASCEMFTLFSKEVRELSGKILHVADDIRNDSAEAFLSQKSAHVAISADLGRLDQLVAAGRATVENASRDAERIVSMSLQILQNASEHTRKVSEAVGEVVVGIQFHDSLSQRVDHIARALEDAGQRCSQAVSQPQGTEGHSREMAAAHSILAIQCAQLQRIVSEIGALYGMNRNALEQIGHEIDDVLQQLSALEGAGPGTGRMKDCFQNLECGLSQLQGLKDQSDIMMDRISAVAARATQVSRRLASYAEVVGEVGYETHIKALNAIINATHLSGEGKTLEILAQQIKTSSDQTNRFVADVTGVIHSISGQVTEDDFRPTAVPENGARDLGSACKNGIFEVYEAFSAGMRTAIERGNALKQAVVETRDELEFLPALEHRFSGLAENLESLCRMLDPWANPESEEVGQLAQRYTMEQERRVHDQFAKGVASNGDESPVNAAEPCKSGENDEDGDFGDNVELF